MSINSFIINNLQATHCFSMNNTDGEIPNILSNSPTEFYAGSYSYSPNPVCSGVTHCLRSTNNTNFSTRVDGATMYRRRDINNSADTGGGGDSSTYNYTQGSRSLAMWTRVADFTVPSCIYEQGGGTNNFAFISGIGKTITWQAADAGQPFLIAQSNFLGIENRNYLIIGLWQWHNNHSGNGNRVIFYINGVEQETVELSGTDPFPSHTGDITVGNTADTLQSYNGGTIPLIERQNDCNYLVMSNNIIWDEALCREFFERTVLPDFIISGTVSEQQAILDGLSGTTFVNSNCAIQIRQATDATNYRLFIDDITFIEDDNLRDIAIQYVGQNTLTIENANGSNVVEISTPFEYDLDGTNILLGDGNINLVENVTRLPTVQDLDTVSSDKLVFEEAGTYSLTNCSFATVENISGGNVVLILQGFSSIGNIPNEGTGVNQVQVISNKEITLTDLPQLNEDIYVYTNTGTVNDPVAGDVIFSVDNNTLPSQSFIAGEGINTIIILINPLYTPIYITYTIPASDSILSLDPDLNGVYLNP